MAKREQPTPGLRIVAAAKLLKAAVLFSIALGVRRLLHNPDIVDALTHLARAVRVDPDNRIVHAVLTRITGLSPRQLQALELGTFLYAALYATEGIGLALRLRWAEYLTVISTALFLPLEIYELLHRFRWIKLAVLAANLAILWYLVSQIRRKPPSDPPPAPPPKD
jgi:uncharacterized membrane protein (DUF2068 family)